MHEVSLPDYTREAVSWRDNASLSEFLIDLSIDLDVLYIREQEIKWERSESIEILDLYSLGI
jgi:hypothetical protein